MRIVQRRGGVRRLGSWVLLCAIFWMVAAASHAGFVGKWGLRDEQPLAEGASPSGYSIEALLDGTAARPYAYRVLAPAVANFVDRTLSSDTKAHVENALTAHFGVAPLALGPDRTFARATTAAQPEFRFRYLVIYYINFLSLFFSLFALRQILLDFDIGRQAAVFAPAAFLLAFPYLQTTGGYFYDSIELLFLSLAFLVAIRGHIFTLLAITIPATLNKEAFFFTLPALYPLLGRIFSWKKAAMVVIIAGVLAGSINVLVKLALIDAPGGIALLHADNLKDYLTLWTYHQLEVTYGVIGPSGAFPATIAVILLILVRGWAGCPPAVRQHLTIAAMINAPLFLFFCAPGELRNLSLLFVGFVILIAVTMEETRRVPPPMSAAQP